MAVIWHGSQNEKRSTNLHTCSDGALEVKITYEGQFATLQSFAPSTGSLIAGYSSVYVEDVELSQTGEGDKAILTVQSSNRATIDIDEIEWLRVDQDIRYHNNFSSAGMWALASTDRDAVDEWNAETDATKKTADYTALSSNAQQLATRLQRGETNYAVYIPIARRTNYYLANPSTGGCGIIQAPAPVCPANDANGNSYSYILTADRAIRRGWLWERVREWTGFSVIDTAIVNNS